MVHVDDDRLLKILPVRSRPRSRRTRVAIHDHEVLTMRRLRSLVAEGF
jgi:hypothetical protein